MARGPQARIRRAAAIAGVAITALALGTGAGIAGAAPNSQARFRARADAICLTSATVQRERAVDVDAALEDYVSDDTAATRGNLADALTGFFVQRWVELHQLEKLSGSVAERTTLQAFETDAYFLIAVANPFIQAVNADRASLVQSFAAEIGGLADKADRAADAAGLLVCGAGRGYVLLVESARPISLAPGAAVSLQRSGRMIAHVGEVLADRRVGAGSVALIALTMRDTPLHRGARATLHQGGIELIDGPLDRSSLGYQATVPLG